MRTECLVDVWERKHKGRRAPFRDRLAHDGVLSLFLKVLPNRRQVNQRCDIQLAEKRLIANSRELEEHRGLFQALIRT